MSTYLIDSADFIACHNPAYVTKYDMLSALKDGGVFLLNSPWTAAEMEEQLPASMKQALAKKHARFYTVDAIKLAREVGMGGRINTIMQAAFFKLANVIPYEQADEYMKAYAKKAYGKKGDEVVKKNWDAIDIAISGLVEIPVPAEWANATTGAARQGRGHRVLRRSHPAHPRAGRRQACPCPSWIRPASCPPAPPSTKSAASPSWCPSGRLTTASSAASAPWSARTPASAPTWWTTRARQRARDVRHQAGAGPEVQGPDLPHAGFPR